MPDDVSYTNNCPSATLVISTLARSPKLVLAPANVSVNVSLIIFETVAVLSVTVTFSPVSLIVISFGCMLVAVTVIPIAVLLIC